VQWKGCLALVGGPFYHSEQYVDPKGSSFLASDYTDELYHHNGGILLLELRPYHSEQVDHSNCFPAHGWIEDPAFINPIQAQHLDERSSLIISRKE
jgi:hypothetical protein